METAMLPHPRTNQVLIEFDEEDQDGLHRLTRFSQCLCNELRIVSWSA